MNQIGGMAPLDVFPDDVNISGKQRANLRYPPASCRGLGVENAAFICGTDTINRATTQKKLLMADGWVSLSGS
jgi:hypothetical protein